MLVFICLFVCIAVLNVIAVSPNDDKFILLYFVICNTLWKCYALPVFSCWNRDSFLFIILFSFVFLWSLCLREHKHGHKHYTNLLPPCVFCSFYYSFFFFLPINRNNASYEIVRIVQSSQNFQHIILDDMYYLRSNTTHRVAKT